MTRKLAWQCQRGGQFGNHLDAAFIPFPDSSWETSYLVDWNGPGAIAQISGYYMPSAITYGVPVGKSGLATGYTTGTITNDSKDCYVMAMNYGAKFYDVFEVSNSTQGGDSGGPMWYGGNTAFNDPYLYGITFSGDPNGSYGNGIKAGYILSEFQLTLVEW